MTVTVKDMQQTKINRLQPLNKNEYCIMIK